MALPEIVLPTWAGKIGGKLPGRPPRFALVFTLNTMLKRGLLPADMSLFDGRTFEIDVLDAGIKMMMREEDPDTLFFNRKLQIEGDTELGLITKNLLDSVDWPFGDWFLKRQMSD
ncbi:Putative lipid carrier protein [Mycobacteroides abscessus subsp. massiliense]|nr:Putative lipid carrier protein [Mycobacteroides abscessus subsp. massiliense]